MTLETPKLKEYLGMILDMEESLYMQDSVISGLNRKISSITIENERGFVEANVTQDSKEMGTAGKALLVIGIINIILTIICVNNDSNWTLFFGFFSLMAPLGLILSLCNLDDKNKAKKSAAQANQRIIENNNRIREERPKKEANISALTVSLNEAIKQRESTSRNLMQLYSANIIYPKYRNLAMISSIYEYIDSGRCETLEGHEGAYNILEVEMRLDRIIVELDKIIHRLDAIMNNQRTLYNAITESNSYSERIVSSIDNMAKAVAYQGAKLDEIKKNCELEAYNSERIQKELHYMNWMNYLDGDYKYANIFNLPN